MNVTTEQPVDFANAVDLLPDPIGSRLVVVDGCWEWNGPRQPYGHGQLYFNGATASAYRVIYELLVGDVPDGLELDHTCKNPPCCRPDHLEPVTHAENMRRGSQSFDSRTRCAKGHELTQTNVITRKTDGRRQCRACKHEARLRRRASGSPE